MGGMNDNDPFAEELRSRLPLPAVSDDLLVSLERRAEWSEKPRFRPTVIIGFGMAILISIYFYLSSIPAGPATQTEYPEETPASAPIAAPANIPIAFATVSDEELVESLPIVSRRHLNSEPAFNFDLDSVATRGESRQDVL